MELGHLHLPMEESTLADLFRIILQARVSTFILMGESTRANGKTIKSMVWDYTSLMRGSSTMGVS